MADDKTGSAGWQVGFGKPPLHSRYQKGRSGNPNGRPKRMESGLSLDERPVLAAALKAAERKVPRRENGRVDEISTRDAVVQATIVAALKGNPRSQALALRLLQDADDAHAAEVRDRNAVWERYKAEMSVELAAAADRGAPPPRILPHPDDVVISRQKGPQFIGPINESEQAKLDATVALRDVLILQDALERRHEAGVGRSAPVESGSALLMALVLDACIPQRYRLPDTQWLVRMGRYEILPKRVLLKRLHSAWREIGHPKPRGYITPSLASTKKQLSLTLDLAQALQAGRLDMDAAARGEWDEAGRRILAKYDIEVP